MRFKENEKEKLLEEIIKKIKKIRKSLNLKDTNFEIVDIELMDNNDTNIKENENIFLIIYALTRSDKSTIIGPGGWVVGKLREDLKNQFDKNLIIRVENYIDNIILKEKKEKAFLFLNKIGLKKGQKIMVLVQCSYDLSILDFLKKYFDVYAISLDIGSVVLPPKNKNIIEDYLINNKIPYNFIKPVELDKKNILKALNSYPCDIICGNMGKYLIKECVNKNIKYIVNNHISEDYRRDDNTKIYILNFLKIYPLKRGSLRSPYLNCPLMIQTCKKNKNNNKNNVKIKIKLIKEIVSNVYDGLIEPTEGSEKIMKIINS
ncbi:hypothetical protein [Methanothermococcus okinawensis]|uniref:Uncharacterized protein n=1 Tax=Methanothermococcus okinawensis (strain DSM 14208 / JCM 11175 / IH1) TaxID=647113 RepID=F8AMX1_METOI|nr:hypothetical protein [Methanothermococcus okinawensis]AEH06094.1 hypothetical protein Metok_0098 [Methanothermococcus okinawensis IH1]